MPFERRAEGGSPSDPLVLTALKKGFTLEHPKLEWKGWGWRHIHAKHGWSSADVSATQQALAYPPIRQANGRLRYAGPVYEQNGEVCARVVIVSDRLEVGEPEPAEIITSFGELQ